MAGAVKMAEADRQVDTSASLRKREAWTSSMADMQSSTDVATGDGRCDWADRTGTGGAGGPGEDVDVDDGDAGRDATG